MANTGNREQHADAGRQSHKNSSDTNKSSNDTSRNQNASGRNQSDSSSGYSSSSRSSGTQGGTHEQHVKAGQQSHKNSH